MKIHNFEPVSRHFPIFREIHAADSEDFLVWYKCQSSLHTSRILAGKVALESSGDGASFNANFHREGGIEKGPTNAFMVPMMHIRVCQRIHKNAFQTLENGPILTDQNAIESWETTNTQIFGDKAKMWTTSVLFTPHPYPDGRNRRAQNGRWGLTPP